MFRQSCWRPTLNVINRSISVRSSSSRRTISSAFNVWYVRSFSSASVAAASSAGSASASSSSSAAETGGDSPLVSAEWLGANLNRVRVVDGSWYMAAEKRDCYKEWIQRRIPSSVYFDLEAASDKTTDLPHMLPSSTAFARFVAPFGISPNDHVVVYDSRGVFSSPRIWFMFRAFGANKVSVLNGGLPAWMAAELPIAHNPPALNGPPPLRPNVPAWHLDTALVRSMADIQQNLSLPRSSAALVLDARSAGRFSGKDAEPRPGLPSGHIPRALSVPFSVLLKEQNGVQVMRDAHELRAIFEKVDPDILKGSRTVVTSCGSGVTACIVGLALHVIGKKDWKLYDGSWTEWASTPNNPIERDPQ